ncbi:sugar kinase [Desulfallas sp. Bu1-1]|jgi:2-dehydro-3-deoxygluconokinase|uniref:sugar kinase n=1 Tax=Desulfallas sp. Bu1-1 TaxID=2787620 RepID=UPI00189F1F3E|nr:sugar kinase [Desulfallas sp. Bu1-1]MBF7082560.1 sugar kinase [Desulfallas sp. Bu1-1]
MQKKVVTFGEIMLRLSTPGHSRFVQADSFDVTYGGGESNVAVSLAQFGLNACYVTKVPNNPIGQCAINHVRRFGVNTDYIARGGERLGIYFLESGSSQRPSKVVYDRSNSSISQAVPEDFNWREIFEGADWFHWTGITPAISDSAASCVREACKVAKEMGVTISCDLNYRKKLWTRDKANKVMTGLMDYVDVCVGNEEDAADVFGIKAAKTDVTKGKLHAEGYKDVARQLVEKFNLKYVAITLRESFSASHNGWSGLLYDGKEFYQSRKYDIIPIVDRVGGGDSFCAGLIYSLVTGKKPQDAIEFAAAASCLKHTVPGDFNLITVDEVELLARGDASGRVQR